MVILCDYLCIVVVVLDTRNSMEFPAVDCFIRPLYCRFSPYSSEWKESWCDKITEKRIRLQNRMLWYTPTFLLMPSIAGISLLLAMLSGETIPELIVFSQPWLILGNFVYIFFLWGPIQEEFGWRGYVLPQLQTRHNALVSSVILWLVWVFGTCLWILCWYRRTSIWYCIFDVSGISIFVALIFHTMVNLSTLMCFLFLQ